MNYCEEWEQKLRVGTLAKAKQEMFDRAIAYDGGPTANDDICPYYITPQLLIEGLGFEKMPSENNIYKKGRFTVLLKKRSDSINYDASIIFSEEVIMSARDMCELTRAYYIVIGKELTYQ